MNLNPIPINKALIDSFTVFIPLENVQILDYKLTEPYKIFYDTTSEIIEELNPPKPIFSDVNGIRFRFSLVVWTHPKTRETQNLISITVTSKFLKEHYFEGINADNVKNVVDHINAQNVIKLDLQTFLNSSVNDIDFCVNYYLQFDAYKTALRMLYEYVKPSKKPFVEMYPRKETETIKKNYGLTFSNRFTASISKPFIKYYHKENELLENSTEFYNTYIYPHLSPANNIKDLIRKEVTIKNSVHKASLIKKSLVPVDNNLKTVSDLLRLPQYNLDLITNVQLKQYFEKRSFSVSEDLSSMEKILVYYITELIDKASYDKLSLLFPLTLIDCKVNRSRTKKKLSSLIDIATSTDFVAKKIEENSFANEFLRMQNIW